jgi:hypothetical protein
MAAGFLHIGIDPDHVRIVIDEQPRARPDIFAGLDEGAVDDTVELGADLPLAQIDLLLATLGGQSRFLAFQNGDLAFKHRDLGFLGLCHVQIGPGGGNGGCGRFLLLRGRGERRLRLFQNLLGRDLAAGKPVHAFETAAGIHETGLAGAMIGLGRGQLRLTGGQLGRHLGAHHILLGA